MTNITFLGLGVMGYPMAGHLQRAGHKVTVYNRTTSKAEKWAKEHNSSFDLTPAAAAQHADIVFCCVGNDHDLRSVTTGKDGAFHGMKPGAIFADHTTTSADIARELYAIAQEKKLHFLDAPVSGGQIGAEKGILTIMVGGDADIFAQAEPVLKAYATIVQLMGPSGSGQLTKMVNQICIVGAIQGLSEGLNFARAAGLDIPTVLSTIRGGAAGSWQLENRGLSMGEGQFSFGFAVDLMRKDLGICMTEAKRNHAPLPLTALIDQFYMDIQNMGGGSYDTSSLILRLAAKKPA